MTRTLVAIAVMLACVASSSRAAADDLSNEELFKKATASIEQGAYDDAIDCLELLADRDFVHPDVSYDRGMAYARRGQSPRARSGDLGRASAALAETLVLRPDDERADTALDRVRHEIVRRRARAGAKEMDLKPSLSLAVVGLLDENTWAALAVAGSLALSLGLIVRFWTRGVRARLGGVVAGSLGALVLLVGTSGAAFARYARVTYRPAVVVVDEAHLVDESGITISGVGSVVPEGASVLVVEQRGTRARIEWGTTSGWLSLGQIRMLARPSGT
jgi:tetratricopeptide (TPR) repeat protein